jgi:hypothetical protein
MSKEHYTGRSVYDESIGVHMPGTEYILTVEEARKLRDSLSSTLREAVIQNEGRDHGCHDCGEERYPKLAHGTLVCGNCLSENIVCIETAAA